MDLNKTGVLQTNGTLCWLSYFKREIWIRLLRCTLGWLGLFQPGDKDIIYLLQEDNMITLFQELAAHSPYPHIEHIGNLGRSVNLLLWHNTFVSNQLYWKDKNLAIHRPWTRTNLGIERLQYYGDGNSIMHLQIVMEQTLSSRKNSRQPRLAPIHCFRSFFGGRIPKFTHIFQRCPKTRLIYIATVGQ